MSMFAFRTAADGYSEISEQLSLMRLQQISGSGATTEALNARLSSYVESLAGWQTLCSAVTQTSHAQDAADVELAKAPTTAQVDALIAKAQAAISGSERGVLTMAAAQARDEAAAAREKHRESTEPNKADLDDTEVPEAAFTGDTGGGTPPPPPHAPTPVPSAVAPATEVPTTASPASTSGVESHGGDEKNPGRTHLSSDMPSRTAMQPMMMSAPQTMPQAGAQPGASSGGYGQAPTMPPMLSATPRPRDLKRRDPLDDLATATSGATGASAGIAGSALAHAVDRGQTVTGVNAKVDTSGVNAPSVSANGQKPGGAPPVGGSGGMRGGMMGGMPMGSGANMTARGPKKSDTPAAFQDEKLTGHQSIKDAVDGGLLSRSTAEEPEFPHRSARDMEPQVKPSREDWK